MILKLKEKLRSLNGDVNERKVKREVEEIETLNIELDHKSSRVQSKEQCDDLINKVNLKSAEVFDLNASLQEKVLVITALKEQLNKLKGKAVPTEVVSLNPIDPELLKVDVAPLVLKLRKNKTAHTDYIRHTQEEAATLREIVEKKLNSLNGDVKESKVKQDVEEIETLNIELDHMVTKLAAKKEHLKQTYKQLYDSVKSSRESLGDNSSQSIVKQVQRQSGVNLVSSASRSLSHDNTKHNRIRRTQKKAKKNKIEDHLRTIKSSLNKESVVDSKATLSVINSATNMNSDLKCALCNSCLLFDNHDACVVDYIHSVNASKKSNSVNTPVKRKVWKTTGKVFKSVGHIWKPTGRIFTLVGNVCPLTRIATPIIVPHREPIPIVNNIDKPVVTLVIQIVLWYLDSDCSKHMTGDRSQLVNFVQKFLGMVKFGNDHVAKIMGYEDYQIGNVTISRASKTKSWLWHRRLSHLNFGAINHLARQGLVRGLPKLKF
nr:integrase, catalytic region, zinc finger, CCHC-type, peptidase aspartic, catalytic [Tanacetum cinerariifolium]